MKIIKGDNVIIISGKDKGKTAKVLRVFPKDNQILVEGINFKKKHQKPKKQGQKGTIITVERPIHASNAMPIDPKTGKGTRKPVREEKNK